MVSYVLLVITNYVYQHYHNVNIKGIVSPGSVCVNCYTKDKDKYERS